MNPILYQRGKKTLKRETLEALMKASTQILGEHYNMRIEKRNERIEHLKRRKNYLVYKVNEYQTRFENDMNDEDNNDVRSDDIALPTSDFKREKVLKKHLFIADSGASCHMVHSIEGMFDVEDIAEEITVGNGNTIYAMKKGKWK